MNCKICPTSKLDINITKMQRRPHFIMDIVTMEVREGACKASMDAPDVGHNVMSGTKWSFPKTKMKKNRQNLKTKMVN